MFGRREGGGGGGRGWLGGRGRGRERNNVNLSVYVQLLRKYKTQKMAKKTKQEGGGKEGRKKGEHEMEQTHIGTSFIE